MSQGAPKYRYEYCDDPKESAPIKSRKSPKKSLAVLALALTALTLKTTLAANISINSGGASEFGQGVQVLAACAGNTPLTISPITSFSNASGAGTYLLTGLTLSNIPTSCYGDQFLINAFAETATAPLALFNTTSSNAIVINSDGTFFTDGSADLGVKTNSNSSVTLTFRTPVARASQASKFTVQSSANTGIYWVSTDQQLYFDASNVSSYSGSGNTVVNLGLAGSSKNGTRISNPVFSNNTSPGHFTFGQGKGISYPRVAGDDFTLAVWFRVNYCDGGTRPTNGQAFDSADGQLLSGSIGGAASDWDFAARSCYLGFQTGSSGGGEETLWATTAFTPNEWHYAVATRVKATGRNEIFIDGVSVGVKASGALGMNQTLGNATQGIGYDTDFGINNRYLNGDIAVVQQYASVLSLADIQKNYLALRSRYGN